MKTYVKSSAIALLLALSSSAFAMTIGYDVQIQNHLSVPAKVEVTQYHSEGFNGTPPRRFTDDLKLGTTLIMLQPGESQTVHYNSASGGFWLQWKRVDSNKSGSPSGILNLADGEHVIIIK